MRKYILLIIGMLAVQLKVNSQVLTLDSCKTYALENNKELKAKQLEVKAAQQVKKSAFTKYFPKIEAGVVAMKFDHYMVEGEIPEMNLPVWDGVNPMGLMMPTQFTYFPGQEFELLDYTNAGFIMAVQPIFMGGRIYHGNKLASLGIEVSELMVEMTTDEVLKNVENYYWSIVALTSKMKTIDNYEKLLQNLSADVTISYEAGLLQKSDLLKIQLKLNEIKTQRLKLNNGISILKMLLAQQMGVDYGDKFALADAEIVVNDPLKLFSNPDEAVKQRTEYQLLNKSVRAEQLKKRMEIGEYLPQMAIGGQAFQLDAMDTKENNAIGFAMLTIPISDWWGGAHKIKEQELKIQIAQSHLDEKTELLKLQINKAYNDLNESFMQISVAESSLNQAQEHLSVVNDNYEAGVVNTSELLEAQAMFQETQDKVVDAKTSYKIKMADYLQAIAKLN